ncbi:MAG: LysR family transcriptional regulator [Pseudomonadota bacterium]
MKLQHLKYFVAVYEEGSFSAGAHRVNATQSGLSMHVKQLEDRYQVRLLSRSSTGVVPTEAGRRFYRHAVGVLRAAAEAEATLRQLSGVLSGHLRIGLMPTFTRAVLGPALLKFSAAYPNVRVSVVEAYSGELSRKVAAGQLDFAVVPAFDADLSLTATLMGTDREFLMVSADSPVELGEVAVLADLPPLNIVLPSQENARRRKIDAYLTKYQIETGDTMELDAMFATLDLVARSDWATILPGILCIPDRDGGQRKIAPLAFPSLQVEYMRIEPLAAPLSPVGTAFYDVLKNELEAALDLVPGGAVQSRVLADAGPQTAPAGADDPTRSLEP